KESSRRPPLGSRISPDPLTGSTPSRRIGAALPTIKGAPNRSGLSCPTSLPVCPPCLQCGQDLVVESNSSQSSVSPPSAGESETRQPSSRSCQILRAAGVGLAAKSGLRSDWLSSPAPV